MNRLAGESSLYLRQHAGNPVDWYPWGPEALTRARELDRPIFLSIGYSACHWCHVMEHESFEDAETARLLNEHFVCVKVDREERPDLDAIYMTAVQALNHGQGGWPMSVWLTPQLEPFYAGTYYPPRDQYGRPGFRRLLAELARAWHERRDHVVDTSGKIADFIRQSVMQPAGEGNLGVAMFESAARVARHIHDPIHGGFGDAPKFPHAIELRLLLRISRRTGDADLIRLVRTSLDHMARGGIYDHLGGGFHRYSTDARWLVPHFEKMLYDNALLSLAYLEAYQATGDAFYRQVTEETLDYVLREMTDAAGPFYATQDADSEGEEGRFYVWTQGEIAAALDDELKQAVESVYGVTPEGNWEGRSILNRTRGDEQDARILGLGVDDLRYRIGRAKRRLYDVRSQRVWPGRDEKIVTAWNGLMINSFARAGAVLDKPVYTTAAVRAAEYILTNLRGPGGRLFRTAAVGHPAKYDAYLEDYAAMVEALVAVHEATFDARWLDSAEDVAKLLIDQFEDREHGGFFTTGRDHETLLARLKDHHDGSTPSGNGLAIVGLLQLAAYTGQDKWRDAAERTLRAMRGTLAERPFSCAQSLIGLDFLLGPIEQVAIVGNPESGEVRQIVMAARQPFAPWRLIAAGADSSVPWLADKPRSADVSTYICKDFVCSAPIVDIEAACAALSGSDSRI